VFWSRLGAGCRYWYSAVCEEKEEGLQCHPLRNGFLLAPLSEEVMGISVSGGLSPATTQTARDTCKASLISFLLCYWSKQKTLQQR
jgi:hypothetical protein